MYLYIGRSEKLYSKGFGVFSRLHENSCGTDGQHGVCIQNWRQLVSYKNMVVCIL